MDAFSFTVRVAAWSDDAEALRAVRRVVFIAEQGVPEALEWDACDATAIHVLASDAKGRPIGTARLTAECRIGRMAVVKTWRGRGVGSAMLRALIGIACFECRELLWLHAQTHAIAFYARHGFEAVGDVFDEVGIPHRAMRLNLAHAHRG